MIPAARKEELQQLARYIREQQAGDRAACVTFICTHNSRRSSGANLGQGCGRILWPGEGRDFFRGDRSDRIQPACHCRAAAERFTDYEPQ